VILEKRPWKADPHYFKQVKISGIALIKMLMHSRDGLAKKPGDLDLEVMGLLQGKIDGDAVIVMDCFGVIKGNEVRVTAGTADFEYMVQYTDSASLVGKVEPVVGWYHSHPGFGCWLSGIDVNTQLTNQTYQDPYIAIVVDPKRTMSSGRVELRAFRTWPADFTPPEHLQNTVPKGKGEFDYGVHAQKYYELKVTVFKSSLDSVLLEQLWSKYWVKTLAVSRNLFNRDFDATQLAELNDQIVEADKNVDKFKGMGGGKKKEEQTEIAIAAKDCSKNAAEQLNGVMNQLLKHQLFNMDIK